MTDEDNEALREGAVTVPPPAGEEDPYGAPTRVARVPDNLLDELMRMREEAGASAKSKAIANADAIAVAIADEDVVEDEDASELSALAAAAAHVVAPEPLSVPVHMQSGRTVPLSSALLAEVIKSVDDKRARNAAPNVGAPNLGAANVAASNMGATNVGAAPIAAVPKRKLGSVLALALVLVLGLSVFAVGVIMFLDARK